MPWSNGLYHDYGGGWQNGYFENALYYNALAQQRQQQEEEKKMILKIVKPWIDMTFPAYAVLANGKELVAMFWNKGDAEAYRRVEAAANGPGARVYTVEEVAP